MVGMDYWNAKITILSSLDEQTKWKEMREIMRGRERQGANEHWVTYEGLERERERERETVEEGVETVNCGLTED